MARWPYPLIVAGAALLWPAAESSADVLVLATGSRERGVIVKESAEGYWLRSGPKMRMFYGVSEVAGVERASAEANLRIRARWASGSPASAGSSASSHAKSSKPEKVAMAASTARRGAATDPAAEDGESKIVKQENRYEYIRGGSFQAGSTKRGAVSKALGQPDKVITADDGSTIWHYKTRGGDLYALQFQESKKGGMVLADTWFVSDPDRRAKINPRRSAAHP